MIARGIVFILCWLLFWPFTLIGLVFGFAKIHFFIGLRTCAAIGDWIRSFGGRP